MTAHTCECSCAPHNDDHCHNGEPRVTVRVSDLEENRAEVDRLATALAQAEESRDTAKVQARGWAEEANALREYAEAERVRANEAEADLRVLREGIKALADGWECAGVVHMGTHPISVTDAEDMCAAQLRALLGEAS